MPQLLSSSYTEKMQHLSLYLSGWICRLYQIYPGLDLTASFKVSNLKIEILLLDQS